MAIEAIATERRDNDVYTHLMRIHSLYRVSNIKKDVLYTSLDEQTRSSKTCSTNANIHVRQIKHTI